MIYLGSTTNQACDNAHQGAIKYEQTGGANNGHFYGCRGSGGGSYSWVQLDN